MTPHQDLRCAWRHRWCAAAARAPVATLRRDIDGHVIRYRIAGAALAAALTPSLAGFTEEAGGAGCEQDMVQVDLWSRAETGIDPPDPDARGNAGLRLSRQDGKASATDAAAGQVIACVDHPDRLPATDLARPFRRQLDLVLAARGFMPLHGAMVAHREQGFLLLAPGGSGKSTTAISLHAAGFSLLGDDAVLLAGDDPPRAHGLYAAACLAPSAFPFLPVVPGRSVVPACGEKLLLHCDVAAVPARSQAITAILLPRLGHGTAEGLESVSAAATLRALVAAATWKDSARPGQIFEALSRVATQVPAFRLTLGPDLSTLPSLLAQLAADVRWRRPSPAHSPISVASRRQRLRSLSRPSAVMDR